jgi:cell surface protein SprA
VQRHDFEIEDYVDQQVNSSVDYAYTFKPKPIEPLKTKKFMKKSNYWKLLRDFNFNYLPSNISFNTNINSNTTVSNSGKWMWKNWTRSFIPKILPSITNMDLILI